MSNVQLVREPSCFTTRFTAMASPCEALIDTDDEWLALRIGECVAACARRIEQRFSRYRSDNIIHQINNANGNAILVDDEVANLLDFAATLTELSEGRFDITSGVLRRAWTFNGRDHVPSQSDLDAILPLIGWHKVEWRRPSLRMPAGMQIDFGGIGKEYAVDRAVTAVDAMAPGISCLVNFGGDVAVRHRRADGLPWRVGIEHPDEHGEATRIVQLEQGGIATSGDSRRFVKKNGRRYSHILDARTGWPVKGAPRSITTVAPTCTQAGTFTTLAMLQGEHAERFLDDAGIKYWIQR